MKSLTGLIVITFQLLSLPSLTSADEEKILIFRDAKPYKEHLQAINAGVAMIKAFGKDNKFSVDTTVNLSSFNSTNLSNYEAVVFMHPYRDVNGEWLNDTMNTSQDSAFQAFMLSGKGLVGIHCADRLNNNSQWYLNLLGVQYLNDIGPQTCTYHVVNTKHPLTEGISQTFTSSQQVRCNKLFFSDTSRNFTVLVKADQKDYPANQKQSFYPYVWIHDYQNARVWCGSMGHSAQTFSTDATWRKLMLRGILYALNRPGYGPAVSVSKSFLPHLVPRETKPELEGSGTIQIYDLSGRMISGMRESSIPHNIPVQDNRVLPSGIYIIAPHSAGSSHGVFRMSSTQ